MNEKTVANPSPQAPRESDREFDRLLRGEGSPQRLATAIKKESRTYVSDVRAGRYRSAKTGRFVSNGRRGSASS